MNAFHATGDAARRQAAALDRWRALDGARLANLQWADGAHEVEGFATHAVLHADARTVSGIAGRRLPVLSETFDRLAELAVRGGCRWFGYANSDVQVTQGAVDRVLSAPRDGYAFSRMDVDPGTGRELEVVTAGVDLLVVAAAWWAENRRRFRAYLGGEPVWDNVYTALLLCHSDAVLLNRAPLVRHERHPAGDWRRSPYAPYLRYLGALDRPYFTLWADYHHRLTALRNAGAGEEEEMRLQYDAFRLRSTPGARLVHAARVLRARLRWSRDVREVA